MNEHFQLLRKFKAAYPCKLAEEPALVSRYLREFIEERLSDGEYRDLCLDNVERALQSTCHLVRATSVARAAGYCAYYARMTEKMGVFEPFGGATSRGREVHRVLGLASLILFSEHGGSQPAMIGSCIRRAIDTLSLDVDGGVYQRASNLLRRLVLEALPTARRLLGLQEDDPLFPIVEQQFLDFNDHVYGAPDLILENKDKGKAIVVEWKTYSEATRNTEVHDYEKAQVLVYAIMEAERLGMSRLEEKFEAISGISIETASECLKALRAYSKAQLAVSGGSLNELAARIRSELKHPKVLPVVVGPKGGFPPHPHLFERRGPREDIKRFARLYELFRGAIIGAEFLTLQITNVPALLSSEGESVYEKLEELREICRAQEGGRPVNYHAFSYTPCEYLRCGARKWDKFPCNTCHFKGDDGPCAFYFGKVHERDYFDKLMWWARFKVLADRELDLVNHRAMDIIFSTRPHILDKLEHPRIFVVNVDSRRVEAEREGLAYLVQVKRGGKEIGKFRFDVFRLVDVNVLEAQEVIELKREVREVEKSKGALGLLRKSLFLTILRPSIRVRPTLSINTFVMVEDVELRSDGIVYTCYWPSETLQYSSRIFQYYIELHKRRYPDALVLAFEAPVDLTIMELRSIDSLHRYLKSIAGSEERLKRLAEELKPLVGENVEGSLREEVNLLLKQLQLRDGVLTSGELYELLSRMIVRPRGSPHEKEPARAN